jgi:peptide chain release factor 3
MPSTCASARKCASPTRSPSWPRSRARREAYAGDIIGLHNHGTINIGDTFTEGEALKFTGIPNFAPELFRRAVLRDPLKMKQLQKGLAQLSRGGRDAALQAAAQQRPDPGRGRHAAVRRRRVRLQDEYSVDCTFEPVQVRPRAGSSATTTRSWKSSARWPDVTFMATREHAHAVDAD